MQIFLTSSLVALFTKKRLKKFFEKNCLKPQSEFIKCLCSFKPVKKNLKAEMAELVVLQKKSGSFSALAGPW